MLGGGGDCWIDVLGCMPFERSNGNVVDLTSSCVEVRFSHSRTFSTFERRQRSELFGDRRVFFLF